MTVERAPGAGPEKEAPGAGPEKEAPGRPWVEVGLVEDEYERIKDILGREPNPVELGLFGLMWSEHCSYKTSKSTLRRLPTQGPRVVQGPGENAGVVDIGDGLAVVFKIESHNHPSFIEPYQGAATGVGGILRDIFAMGARPIAILDSLRFGELNDDRQRWLFGGVVGGIGGYGNCFGCPTVGGEVHFDSSYRGNPLVNAMCVGLVERGRVFYGRAEGAGNPVILVGSKTGRDGIHGASLLASKEFDERAEERRPAVQVGDPFLEKLLLEACLELLGTGAVVGLNDLGAAGLTSAASEMASRGGHGLEIDLDRVPRRDPIRGDALGIAGTHARRGQGRPRGRGPAGLRQMGSGRRDHRSGHVRRPSEGHREGPRGRRRPGGRPGQGRPGL